MRSSETQELRQAIVEIVEEAEKKCTDLILVAVRAKSQPGMKLAGEATIKLREIIDVIQQPIAASEMETMFPRMARKVKAKRKVRKGEYPKFHAENLCLVKVGWSKKAKKEYVHKLPRDVYEDLLEIIARRAALGTENFAAEEILQASQRLTESVPDYQIYLTLAFLQDRGILEKEGRRGYRAQQDVQKAGLAAWESSRIEEK